MTTPLPEEPPGLRRAMGFGDVVLFFVTAGTNLQWVATAAAAGPSALVVWFVGLAAMALPLAFCVIELSRRYPQEGGLYIWSKHAFGDFAGFMTGWTYWTSNLPYFPGVLYFATANILLAGGQSWQSLSGSRTCFIAMSILGLVFATVVNLVGLDVGKWLTNAGAIGRWLATIILIGLGIAAWRRFGFATPINAATLRPGLHFKELIFWSTIAFALTGLEAASFMGGEIRDPRRNIRRGILAAVPLITLIYVLGTASVLVALPGGEVSGLQGIMQAIRSAADRVGFPGIAPVAALLIAISSLASVGAWLAAVARIPFVAGLDHFLPEGFGRLHPRWGSPYVALLTQSGISVVFVVLGQAGTSVKGAYDTLVSMTILATFIPFLFIFGAAIKVQSEPEGRRRGRPLIVLLGGIGFLTTLISIVLSAFPSEDEPNKALALVKILGLTLLTMGVGVLVYVLGRRSHAKRPTRSEPALKATRD
jgi:amino acid transporter